LQAAIKARQTRGAHHTDAETCDDGSHVVAFVSPSDGRILPSITTT
jgi:hypothetical protein